MGRTTALGLCSLALAGAVSLAAAPPTQEQATAEAQVRALEREWVNAEIHKDAAALRRILDEKFVATVGAGRPFNREAFIRAVVSGTDTDVTQTLSDAAVVVDRDTAVVIGTDTVRGVAKGTPYSHAYRYTATYVRRNGRWVALAEHMVRVLEAK
jgi:ketosteroid isomerase-like protein